MATEWKRTMLLAAVFACLVTVWASPAAANHDSYGCGPHGGDTDRDGTCDDSDQDDDNDGAKDKVDAHPKDYGEVDFALAVVKELIDPGL